MQPIDQTLFGNIEGNCFASVIASLLEMPLEEVPNFCAEAFPDNFDAWIRDRGFTALPIEIRAESEWRPQEGQFCELSGPSPRGDFDHSVVGQYLDGEYRIVHDPHPSREGLRGGPRGALYLIPLDPAQFRQAEQERDAAKALATTCPICEKVDPGGLEACSACYGEHFKSTLRLDKARAENTKLKAQVSELEAELEDWKEQTDHYVDECCAIARLCGVEEPSTDMPFRATVGDHLDAVETLVKELGAECDRRLDRLVAYERDLGNAEAQVTALEAQLERIGNPLSPIVEAMRGQDNRCTGSPIYIVQQRRRVYGFDPDYSLDEKAWIYDGEPVAHSPEEWGGWLVMNEMTEEEAEEMVTVTGYQDTWEFAQPFFSDAGAERYIENNRHNLVKPRIYVASGYNNPEWKAVRKALAAMALPAVEVGECGRPLVKARQDVSLSPREKCRRYQMQDCHVCEDTECGDNMSPAAEEIRRQRELVRRWWKRCMVARIEARAWLLSCKALSAWINNARGEELMGQLSALEEARTSLLQNPGKLAALREKFLGIIAEGDAREGDGTAKPARPDLYESHRPVAGYQTPDDPDTAEG